MPLTYARSFFSRGTTSLRISCEACDERNGLRRASRASNRHMLFVLASLRSLVCVCVLAPFASPLLDLPPFDFRRSERKRVRTPLSLFPAPSPSRLPSFPSNFSILEAQSGRCTREGEACRQAMYLGKRRKTRNMHERIKRKKKKRNTHRQSGRVENVGSAPRVSPVRLSHGL